MMTTRDAHVLTAGLRSLLSNDVLKRPTWEAMERIDRGGPEAPRGRFFNVFDKVRKELGYQLDYAEQRVTDDTGAVVRSAPTQLASLVAKMVARRDAAALPEGLRMPTTVAQPHRGAVARLLAADSGPRPALDREQYRAAVRLVTGVADGTGGPCPLCGKERALQGHHRWCAALMADSTLQHHKVRDAVAAWVASAPGARARTEHMTW